jgi:hypothetical protein
MRLWLMERWSFQKVRSAKRQTKVLINTKRPFQKVWEMEPSVTICLVLLGEKKDQPPWGVQTGPFRNSLIEGPTPRLLDCSDTAETLGRVISAWRLFISRRINTLVISYCAVNKSKWMVNFLSGFLQTDHELINSSSGPPSWSTPDIPLFRRNKN